MNYIQLLEILFLCFFYVLFVRIQWWLCQNPQLFCLFPQQFLKAGTVCEQGEASKNKMGNFQAFILWSEVWFGPRHSCCCREKKLLRSTLGRVLLCSSFSDGHVQNPGRA